MRACAARTNPVVVSENSLCDPPDARLAASYVLLLGRERSRAGSFLPRGPLLQYRGCFLQGFPMDLPEQFGRYRIVKKLGSGGMGAVYLAQDTALGRAVALKVPHFGPGDGPEARQRFRREA